MEILGKRFPIYVQYEAGVNGRGAIQYLKANLYSDFGQGGNEFIHLFLIDSFKHSYNIETWHFSCYIVKTDTPANCWTRGPGKILK